MRASLIAIIAALGVCAPAAAQGWTSLDQRRADFEQRIDAGVREGQITREEAARLREDFRSLLALQDRFRVNGLNAEERRELDRRFDALRERIRAERRDAEANLEGQGASPERRLAMARQRIEEGAAGGALSRPQASRLAAEAQDVAALQARYAAEGFTPQERAELDRRYDALDDKIRRGEVVQMGYQTAGDRR